MKKRKQMTVIFMLLLITWLISGCSGQTSTQHLNNVLAPKEIRIGIVPLPHYAHVWVAKKKGFLDEELSLPSLFHTGN